MMLPVLVLTLPSCGAGDVFLWTARRSTTVDSTTIDSTTLDSATLDSMMDAG